MTVQFDDSTSIEIENGVFVHLVNKESDSFKDFENLSPDQQIAYESFLEDVKRAYRGLLSNLDHLSSVDEGK